MKKYRIYISGRMSGVPRHIYKEQFLQAEERLKGLGYDVVNPCGTFAYLLHKVFGYYAVLAYDLWRLSRCDAIFMLDGWKESRGARIERAAALADRRRVLLEEMTDKEIDLTLKGIIRRMRTR